MINVDNGHDSLYVHQTNSSAIESFGFYYGTDEDDNIVEDDWGYLVVNFRGDNETQPYYYYEFCLSTFFEMTNAESIGRFFNERIRNSYQAVTY